MDFFVSEINVKRKIIEIFKEIEDRINIEARKR